MTTKVKNDYEQFLLEEIKSLPQSELPKILKLIHFFKEEILQKEHENRDDLQAFWDSFGSWQDERSPEEIIREIYESRQSTNRDIQL